MSVYFTTTSNSFTEFTTQETETYSVNPIQAGWL